jgi:hypothetical protein
MPTLQGVCTKNRLRLMWVDRSGPLQPDPGPEGPNHRGPRATHTSGPTPTRGAWLPPPTHPPTHPPIQKTTPRQSTHLVHVLHHVDAAHSTLHILDARGLGHFGHDVHAQGAVLAQDALGKVQGHLHTKARATIKNPESPRNTTNVSPPHPSPPHTHTRDCGPTEGSQKKTCGQGSQIAE